jgi:Acetyltransferases, including N-acetylases of ribosomal proteins
MNSIIRKARKGDAKGVVESRNEGIERGFYIYTGTNEPLNIKDIRRYDKGYARKKKNQFVFLAIDKDTKKVAGVCSFNASEHGRTRHVGILGWGVHPDYPRRGIATKLLKAVLKEAKKRGFKKVEAEVAVGNIASIKLAKKCGFALEGRKRAGILLDDGTYMDTYIFGKIIN